MAYEIDQIDRRLLDLVSGRESAGRYDALYPSTRDPQIPQLTLAQIDAYQTRRINSGIASSAIGRYQFIQRTLRGAREIAGIASNVQFSEGVQDYLMIAVLRNSRRLNQWKSGSLSDADFCLQLAREFASVPVPYDTQGHHRRVQKGETYYASDGLNRAGHSADAFIACLRDIRNGGPGNIEEIDITTSDATNTSAGTSPVTQAEIQAGGGQRIRGGNPADRPIVGNTLPSNVNPYIYKTIDPYDNRYDFRTGEKVRDLLVNGTNPISASGGSADNGRPPVDDGGRDGLSGDQIRQLGEGRTIQTEDGTFLTQRTVDTPAGPQTVYERTRVVQTPAGPQHVRVPYASGSTQPNVTTTPPARPEPQFVRPSGPQ